MRIALIDGRSKILDYPIALLRIGGWLKSQGHTVDLFQSKLPNIKYDEIWISVIFSFDIPFINAIINKVYNLANKIKIGGVATHLNKDKIIKKDKIEIYQGLLENDNDLITDYSLLNKPVDYSIARITRGCSNKCGFCIVPKIEPIYKINDSWEKDVVKSKEILFYDNNILTLSCEDLKYQVNKIKSVIKKYDIKSIDFNQGMDCRLATPEKLDIITQLPLKYIRFAFDGMQEDGYYQEATKYVVNKTSFKGEFFSYMLYNFKESPEEIYYRLKVVADLTHILSKSIKIYPMKYQPLNCLNKNFIGNKWKKDEIKNFIKIYTAHTRGSLSICFKNKKLSSYEMLKFWYGESEKEFKSLLNYNKINELLEIKKNKIKIINNS